MIHLLRNKKLAKSKGFTLIELLVVIAIIGILATIVLASLNGARRKARDTRRAADIKQIQLALELYFDGDGNGQYPISSGAACSAPAAYFGLSSTLVPKYISVLPTDPVLTGASACYKYRSVTNNAIHIGYHLAAILEDPSTPVLNGDADCDDTAAGACNIPAGAAWDTPPGGASIDGLSAACITATTADQCYDVVQF